MTVSIYRAPMRSRRSHVDMQATLDRAMGIGVCGSGGVLLPPPVDLQAAIDSAADQYDIPLARRIARFAAVATGSFVWTRDTDRLFWLGSIEPNRRPEHPARIWDERRNS